MLYPVSMQSQDAIEQTYSMLSLVQTLTQHIPHLCRKDNDDDIQHVTISKITHLKYGGNGNGVPIEYKIAHENKDLTWMDISNKKINNETLEDKFIIDYDLL